MRRNIFYFLVLVIFTIPQTQAQEGEAASINFPLLENKIAEILEQYNITGCAVGLTHQGKALWKTSYGWADREALLPVDDKTIFRLGSVSKVFTAIAILQLKEKGLLSLEDKASDFIPKPDFSFTIRDLLTHHSGLPSDHLKGFFTADSQAFGRIEGHLLQQSLSQRPRTSFAYSNLGYDLLGLIVEKVSGQTFETYIREHIFEPLDMKHSFFLSPPEMEVLVSRSYKAKGEELSEPLLRDIPAVMLQSNLADMQRFMGHFLQIRNSDIKSPILSSASYRLMTEVQNEDVELDFDRKLGLGLFLYERFSQWEYLGGAVGHAGDTYLFHSQMTLFPHLDLGLIVMTNSELGSQACEAIEWVLADHVANQKFGLSYSRNSKWVHGRMRSKPRSLKTYQGTYALGTEATRLKARHGRLTYKNEDGRGILLPDGKEGLFVIYGKGFRGRQNGRSGGYVFFHQVNGKNVMTGLGKQGEILLGIEEEIAPIPDNWKEFLGNYEALDPKDEFFLSKLSLEKKQGFLVLKASVFGRKPRQRLTINPLSEGEGRIIGLGRNSGDRVEIFANEGGKFLLYSGIVWRKK